MITDILEKDFYLSGETFTYILSLTYGYNAVPCYHDFGMEGWYAFTGISSMMEIFTTNNNTKLLTDFATFCTTDA